MAKLISRQEAIDVLQERIDYLTERIAQSTSPRSFHLTERQALRCAIDELAGQRCWMCGARQSRTRGPLLSRRVFRRERLFCAHCFDLPETEALTEISLALTPEPEPVVAQTGHASEAAF